VAAITFQVQGEATFEATIATAARKVADLSEGFAGAARELAWLAAGAAPRRTGRLASSMGPGPGAGPSSSLVTSPLVYAVPIHWGRPAHNIEANPFVYRVAVRDEAKWLAPLELELQRTCDGVRGA